jgi:hypothetical protein
MSERKRGPSFENVKALIDAALMVYEDHPEMKHVVVQNEDRAVLRLSIRDDLGIYQGQRAMSMVHLQNNYNAALEVVNFVGDARAEFMLSYLEAQE